MRIGSKFFFAALVPVFLVSCQSAPKDLFISTEKAQTERDLAGLERMIVALDSAGMTTGDRQIKMAAARKMIGGMEKEAAADADYAGRLAAWSGRLAIFEGRYSEARRQYRESLSLSPGNLPAAILGIRLEGDPARRLEIIERELALIGPAGAPGFGETHIEKGRALLELRRFAEAAAAFDTAFAAGLDSVYAETYREARERAWELRNTEGYGGPLEALEQGGLNWKNCVSLVKTETDLLRFISAGRDLNEAELFSRLLDRGFIPSTQDVAAGEWPAAKPRIEDPVFRSGAAWLVWHLWAEARGDRGLLSKYSARWNSGRPNAGRPASGNSPIADIPPLSPFFDSVLGCVETEFLSLPDGRNFKPAEPIRGAEFLAVLRKMK